MHASWSVAALARHASELRFFSARVRAVRSTVLGRLAEVGRYSSATDALLGVAEEAEARAHDLEHRAAVLGGLDPFFVAFALLSRTASTNQPTDADVTSLAAQLEEIAAAIDAWNGTDNDPIFDHMVLEYEAVAGEFERAVAGWVEADPAPAARAATFDDMPDVAWEMLAERRPDIVTALDGAPFELRIEATRVLLERAAGEAKEKLNRALNRPLPQVPAWLRTGIGPVDHFHPIERARREALAERRRLALRLNTLETWLEGDRRFIGFDPEADGRIIEVFGDLEHADHIAVLVPGIGNTIDNFDANLVPNAEALIASSDGDIAVVAWLGYDTPHGFGLNVDAATTDNAKDGGPRLTSFADGLRITSPDAYITVVAHSYGSVMTGWGAKEGFLDIDALVLIGSPNVPLAHADDFGLPNHTEVYVGEIGNDIVALVGDISDGLPVGHGHDPGDCTEFGSFVFEVGEHNTLSWTHSDYMLPDSVSLQNITAIATGNAADAAFVCTPTSHVAQEQLEQQEGGNWVDAVVDWLTQWD